MKRKLLLVALLTVSVATWAQEKIKDVISCK